MLGNIDLILVSLFSWTVGTPVLRSTTENIIVKIMMGFGILKSMGKKIFEFGGMVHEKEY